MKTKVLILSLVMMSLACQKDPVSSDSGLAQITLKARYISSATPGTGVNKMANTGEINAITVSRARFLVRNVTLRSALNDSIEFKSDPYIIDLNLNGEPNTITVKDINAGTYDRLDFNIHKLDDDDPRDLAYFQHPDFRDFIADNRYSIIIEGIVQDGNNPPESFIFRSRENEKQRHFLNPVLTVDQSTSQAAVNLEINGEKWFVAENGSLLDPRDEANQSEISENLEQSISVSNEKSSDDTVDDSNNGSDDDNPDYDY